MRDRGVTLIGFGLVVLLARCKPAQPSAEDTARYLALRDSLLNAIEWRVDSTVSAVDGALTVKLKNWAKAGDAGGPVILDVTCGPRELDVVVSSMLDPFLDSGGERTPVRWRVSGGAPQTDTWSMGPGGLIARPEPKLILRAIAAADSFHLSAQRAFEASFVTRGLRPLLGPCEGQLQ